MVVTSAEVIFGWTDPLWLSGGPGAGGRLRRSGPPLRPVDVDLDAFRRPHHPAARAGLTFLTSNAGLNRM